MNQTVELFIKRNELINKDDHIIVAVSGGPDSMALLYFFLEHPTYFRKLSVAHVEHGLRGETSIQDMAFVKAYCEQKGIPFYCHQPNVYEAKAKHGFSTQEAARYCRYEWFEKLMAEIGATKLALAHHGDDQIETILMRQVRGGVSGLRGIPVKRPYANGMIIRPLLCVSKQQILDYCQLENIPYKIDESNETEAYQRNRFRKHMLPFLKEENSKVHEVFQRQSEWFHEEDQYLQNLAKEEMEKVIVEKNDGEITLSIDRFSQVPLALQRRGLHLILNYLSQEAGTHVTMQHLELIIDMLKHGKPSSVLHLPKGILVEKRYKHCVFYCISKGVKVKSLHEKKIEIPGITYIGLGYLRATIVNKTDVSFGSKDEDVFYADMDKLKTPLFVRSRKQGDYFAPFGLDGTKKVKHIFIEKKVPKKKRDTWPIVVDCQDEILWLPHLRRSNKALIDQGTEKILVLTYEKSEE